MQLDRDVSEYMQSRNILATKVGGIMSAQLLLVAVFFCLSGLTGNNSHIMIPIMCIASLLISISGSFAVLHGRKIYKHLPDDIGLRQSVEILEYAYSVARPALIFKMTISGIILSAGILLELLVFARFSIGKSLLFVVLAIFILIFVPSFDRIRSYKEMMSKHLSNTLTYSPAKGITFFCTMPLSVCAYLCWKYLGSSNNDIAWIVFCVAGVLYGVVTALADKNSSLIIK